MLNEESQMPKDVDQYKKEVLIAAQQVTQVTVAIMKESKELLQEFTKNMEQTCRKTYGKLDKLSKTASPTVENDKPESAPTPGRRK